MLNKITRLNLPWSRYEVFLVLGLTALSFGAFAGWEKLGTTQSASFYYDPSSIQKSGEIVKLKYLEDHDKRPEASGEKKRYLSAIILAEYDCIGKRNNILQITRYSEAMGAGATLLATNSPSEWDVIAPGTVAEKIFGAACSSKLGASITQTASPAPAPKQRDWNVESPFEFSIRCSKPARRVEFGGFSNMFVEQIYLRFKYGQLSRLSYSTTQDAPHKWMNSESPVTYTSTTEQGKSKIQSERGHRKIGTETISNITVTLDASDAGDMLERLLSDFVTHGAWEIVKKAGSLTLSEKTSTLTNGKLTQSAASYWVDCNLMTADGDSVYF